LQAKKIALNTNLNNADKSLRNTNINKHITLKSINKDKQTAMSNNLSVQNNPLRTLSDTSQTLLDKAKQADRPTLNDYIDQDKKKKSSAVDSFTMNSGSTAESNYGQLNALEKYRYILSQSQKIDVNDAINQPEKTLEEAEKIIERTLKQGLSDADKANLQKALQAKQIAQQRLDMLG
jgi:hypothetical protein